MLRAPCFLLSTGTQVQSQLSSVLASRAASVCTHGIPPDPGRSCPGQTRLLGHSFGRGRVTWRAEERAFSRTTQVALLCVSCQRAILFSCTTQVALLCVSCQRAIIFSRSMQVCLLCVSCQRAILFLRTMQVALLCVSCQRAILFSCTTQVALLRVSCQRAILKFQNLGWINHSAHHTLHTPFLGTP